MQTQLFNKPDIARDYREGATTVFFKDKKYFFSGDIEHCGEENIFYNARLMKDDLSRCGHRYAHKNYNDPPTFDKKLDLKREEWNRINIYKDDLYIFAGNDIQVYDKWESGKSKLLECILMKDLEYHLYKGERVTEESFAALGKLLWNELTNGISFLNGAYVLPESLTIKVERNKF